MITKISITLWWTIGKIIHKYLIYFLNYHSIFAFFNSWLVIVLVFIIKGLRLKKTNTCFVRNRNICVFGEFFFNQGFVIKFFNSFIPEKLLFNFLFFLFLLYLLLLPLQDFQAENPFTNHFCDLLFHSWRFMLFYLSLQLQKLFEKGIITDIFTWCFLVSLSSFSQLF